MPDPSHPKPHAHPWKSPSESRPVPAASVHLYAELQATSNFTFLTGASHPDELVQRAAEFGLAGIAITDTNTLAGIVRAHVAAKDAGIKLIVGCRLVFVEPDTPSVLVYPIHGTGYANLCRLLTLGKRRAPKGECHLHLHDLLDHHHDLLAVVVPPKRLDERFVETVLGLQRVFDADRLSLAVSCHYEGDHAKRIHQVSMLAEHTAVPLVAVNDVHYHSPERRPLQDVLTCVRHGCTLDEAGFRLFANAERHLKSPDAMARLFAAYPAALARSVEIADRAAFRLDELKYQYPDEIVPPGCTPMEHLIALTQRGAAERFPGGVTDKVRAQLEHEFQLIDELNYASYFLTVHDIVTFARSRGILCQGRGAAANSAVCFCLGVTAVDPSRVAMLFERFISKERNEPPDIDIDFEHERREEVIQYLYQKYGRDRAALTAVVISYRTRSAIRDVGKTLGLSLDLVDQLAKHTQWFDSDGLNAAQLRELNLNPNDPTLRLLAVLVREVQGFPRHLSQHVGGFVITRGPLCEMVPVENAAMEDRTIIEWDKDDIDAVGMLKVDVLGLGILTCLRKTMDLIEQHHRRPLTLATIPPEDPAVYDALCRADSIGVFQVESRAQMAMLPRLKPREYYDLVIQVAIVRPGPIQGGMVHPYLKRRAGQELVSYPSEEVESVLSRTLGVPLFQEQAMAMAIVAGGFTPGEADKLRRAMAAWKRKGNIMQAFCEKLVSGMIRNGYSLEFAQRCFAQIQGFSEYGFPESHAASFALLVYSSSWLKQHYPAAFACGLLNSQPMGFYAPAQIVRDAQNHGVQVRPIDVNHSQWDCTLEDTGSALRLGMSLAKSIKQPQAERIARAVREHGAFDSIESLWHASGVNVTTLRALAAADAFNSIGLDRQHAIWQVLALDDASAPLFEQAIPGAALMADSENLPAIPEVTKVTQDYASAGLSLKRHPVSFLRESLEARGVIPASNLLDDSACPNGRRVRVAGIVLHRQRPGTARGIVFITLEDETGVANLILRPHVFERFRRAACHSVLLLARGKVERQGQVVHILVRSVASLDRELASLHAPSRDFH